MPVPLRGRDCGLPDALSVTVTAADEAPSVVGAYFTLMVQLAFTASKVPAVHENAGAGATNENCEALVPLNATPVMVSVAVPVLVTVETSAAPVLPTMRFPNARLVGLNDACGLPDCAG